VHILLELCVSILLILMYTVAIRLTKACKMRRNVDIDDRSIAQALQVTGLPTKRAAIERGLELLVEKHSRLLAISGCAGIGWSGDWEEIRDRDFTVITEHLGLLVC
jgi:Arc/MetJ family transcription regulator